MKIIAMLHIGLLLGVTFAVLTGSASFAQEKLWVTADVLYRRSCPNTSCPVVGRLYFRESADLHEHQGEWVWITRYYVDTGCASSSRTDYVREGSRACLDEHGYGPDGSFAEWVHGGYLSAMRPKEKLQPTFPEEMMDPRIQGIPKVGQLGNSERDVLILRKGALKMLETGRCKQIENGDKSTTRPGYYYVYCGGYKNHFFTAADVE